MISNSRAFIDREQIFRTLGGVDFGPRTFVIARSPRAMLLWLAGHSWSLNGHQRYSESGLVLISDRRQMDNYKNIGPRGGRFKYTQLVPYIEQITDALGSKNWQAILTAARDGKTLLIEGGGDTPFPVTKSRKEGHT
jgi:hypothetical protein